MVDDRGNVMGVVVAKSSQKAALAMTATLSENLCCGFRTRYLLRLLEALPVAVTGPKRRTFAFVNNRLDSSAISTVAGMVQMNEGTGSLQMSGGGEDSVSRATARYRKRYNTSSLRLA